MRNKAMAIIIKPDEVDEFGAILNCAVRYCIGRESYMPKLVTDFLRKHPEMLDEKSVSIMIRDIDQAKDEPLTEWEIEHNRTGLGLYYQHQMWVEFQTWLKAKEKELNEQRTDQKRQNH